MRSVARAVLAIIWIGEASAQVTEKKVPAAPLTQQQKELLKERDRLQAQVLELEKAGKLREALGLSAEMLRLERKVLGNAHSKLAGSLEELALLHQALSEFPEAEKALQERLNILERIHGKVDWRVTDARWDRVTNRILQKLTPTEHRQLDKAKKLNQEAIRLHEDGQSRLAVQRADESLQLCKMILGENHPDIATSLNNLASAYQAMGAYDKALPLYQRARDLRKKLLGENHPDFATCLNNLAELYRVMGAFDKALPLFQQARDLRKKLLGEDHPDFATCLNNLAELYRVMGAFDKALPLFQQAGDLYKKLLGECHPSYATSLNNLANLYQDMGAYDKALPLLGQARDLFKKLLGENHPSYVTSLNNLAALYLNMGGYDKALLLLQQARDLRKKLLGENHPNFATSLNNLAALYQAMGAYDKALPLYQQARDLRKKLLGDNHPSLATSLNNLAFLYREMGAYDKALPLYQQARDLRKKLLGENHPSYADSLNNLAELFMAMGANDKALPLYQQAGDLFKKLLGENHPSYATSLNNLAALYEAMDAYDKALPLYQQAHDLRKKLLGENHPEFALSLNNLAFPYRAMGAYDKALPLYQHAGDLFKKLLGENHPSYATSLNNLAYLYQAMGASDRALPLFAQALRIQGLCLDRTFALQSERERLRGLAWMERYLTGYLTVADLQNKPALARYGHVLSFKGQVAMRGAEELAAVDHPELADLVEKLRLARANLAAIAGKPAANPGGHADWVKRFENASRQREKLEVALAQKSDAFRRFREIRQAGPEGILAALPADAALVDFLVYRHAVPVNAKFKIEKRLLAFVLLRGKKVVLEDLGPAEPIEKALEAWRRAVKNHQPVEEPGRDLSSRVWQPLVKHLAEVKTVLIAPDSFLCGLPFAALPGRKPGSYLLEEYGFGTIPSGRHLLLLEEIRKTRPARGLLALGGLDYGKRTTSSADADIPALFLQRTSWPPLPGTRGEIDRLAAPFQQAFPREKPSLLRDQADAVQLKQALENKEKRPRYLHLATHGFFEPPPKKVVKSLDDWALLSLAERHQQSTYYRNPLLKSGLVLGGANTSPEKGTLTAEEVSSLDLRGTELVVLSACDTGLGKVAGGEGVLGLQRAFQSAGARTLITSLWSVNDAATAILMEEFYANLWTRKMPKLEALRQAQLTVLRHPKKIKQRQDELLAELRKRGVPDELLASRGILSKAGTATATAPVSATESPRSHPRYWAAFVLSGDWR